MDNWRVKVALVLAILAVVTLGLMGELALQGKAMPAAFPAVLTVAVSGVAGLLTYHVAANGGSGKDQG